VARSTRQQTASAPAALAPPNARAFQPSKTSKPGANGTAGSQKLTHPHDGAPGLGSPIFDELIAELGDPRD
jgi:hypothetical protein